jgi:hypothetical protein
MKLKKINIVKNMFKRAEIICDPENLEDEINFVKDTLKKNNYPNKMLRPSLY